MSVRRYGLTPEDFDEAMTTGCLRGDPAHYLGRVLRLTAGDEVELYNGVGQAAICRIDEIGGDRRSLVLQFTVCDQKKLASPAHTLVLIQGIPKGKKPEQIVRQNTEFGAQHICFFHADRTQGQNRLNVEKLEAIRDDAVRQSGRYYVPSISVCDSLSRALELYAEGCLVFGDCAEGPLPVLEQISEARLIVGPEGGLSPEEVELICSKGGVGFHYAPHILRTETAGVVGLSAIYHKYMLAL